MTTLAGVLAQTDVELEVLVVDDGSTDGTCDALAALGDARVRVLRNETSQGVVAARNRGLSAARGTWVGFCDDDDLWAPGKLASQIRAAEEAGRQWAVAGAVGFESDGTVRYRTIPPPDEELASQLPWLNTVPGGSSNVVARRGLIEQAGGFDGRFRVLADWDLWIRLSTEARLGAVPRPLTAYLRHPTSLSHDLTDIEEEYEYTRGKHAAERRARGLPESSRTLEWFVYRQVQAGNRRVAARAYLELWRHYDSPKSLRWAAAALVAPGALRRRRDRAALRRLPPWWLEEGERWLAPLRQGSRPGGVTAPAVEPLTSAS
jgi:glycosyltransferase involved in cell wall biosynthesis